LLEEFPRCGVELVHSEAHLQLGDTLGPAVGIAQESNVLGEATDPGTAHKAFDTPEGFPRYHYKLWFTQLIAITAYLPFSGH
jgi:hypothetical protein